jgi:hypothetical protein
MEVLNTHWIRELRFPCPNVTKRTLVKYVETETGSYLPDEFGRCDREKTVVITKHHQRVKGVFD